MDDSSVNLIARWRQGDSDAADILLRRYTDRLIRLARSRLPKALSGRIDPEDVVQSVYRSFCAEAPTDRYVLERSGDLWRLLAAITIHKVMSQVEHHGAAKRAVSKEQTEAAPDVSSDAFMEAVARDPSPSEAAAVTDELQLVLNDLSPTNRTMVELRLQGHTFEHIAQATERSERMVRRVLEQVKDRLLLRRQEFATSCP